MGAARCRGLLRRAFGAFEVEKGECSPLGGQWRFVKLAVWSQLVRSRDPAVFDREA